MTIRLYPPRVMFRASTPADDWAANANMLVLGATYPKYDGTVIHDHLDIRTPLFISNPVPIKDQLQVTLVGRVNHNFTWDISLPPDPRARRWISKRVTWDVVNHRITGTGGQSVTPAPVPLARIELLPQPDAPTFCNHIWYHEMQHAVDHRWIVEKVFGPWDAWLEGLGSNPFRAKASSFDWIAACGDWGTTTTYFIRYYKDATDIIGDHFHATPEGSRPQVRYRGLVNDRIFGPTAQFEISHGKLLYAAPDFYKGQPHSFFRFATIGNFARTGATTLQPDPKEHDIQTPALTQKDIDDREKPDEVDEAFGEFLSNF